MADFSQFQAALDTYVKPATFPVAAKMVKGDDAVPEEAQSPLRDLGRRLVLCQAWNLVRRLGGTLCLRKEDLRCPIALAIFGFEPLIPYYVEGNLCAGGYTETPEAGARSEAALDKFPHGTYEAVLLAPITSVAFEPDVVFLYGNPAQVMRLVHAALYKEGGRLESSTSGRADCADLIITPLKSQTCHLVLPCHGDRRLGQVHDHEMAFTLPADEADTICEGLAGTHEGGLRYPIRSYMDYEVIFPQKYEALLDLWKEHQA